MHDTRDRMLVERPFEGLEVGDVPADEGDAVGLVPEDEAEPRHVVAEVVADHLVPIGEDGAGDPGAETAQDTGDEKALAHASGASW